MELFAWLETDRFAWGDGNLGPGAGVSANSGLAWANAEDAEATKFDAVARSQSLFQALKDGVNGGFRLGAG